MVSCAIPLGTGSLWYQTDKRILQKLCQSEDPLGGSLAKWQDELEGTEHVQQTAMAYRGDFNLRMSLLVVAAKRSQQQIAGGQAVVSTSRALE